MLECSKNFHKKKNIRCHEYLSKLVHQGLAGRGDCFVLLLARSHVALAGLEYVVDLCSRPAWPQDHRNPPASALSAEIKCPVYTKVCSPTPGL